MEVLLPMQRSPVQLLNTTATASASTSLTPSGEPFRCNHHHKSAPTSPIRAANIYSHFSFDFAFENGVRTEISTADELFEEGKIRPLHTPQPDASASMQGSERGRQRVSPAFKSRNKARESRSLSPLRSSSFSNITTTCISRKWRLKDLLLFRSSSEGRVTGRGRRDPLRKYALLSPLTSFSSAIKKKAEEDSSCGGFSSAESFCPGAGTVRRSRGQEASPHETHYTMNRAAAEEQRKKTPWPYQRQGLFSCLQFNPAIRSIAKGFRS